MGSARGEACCQLTSAFLLCAAPFVDGSSTALQRIVLNAPDSEGGHSTSRWHVLGPCGTSQELGCFSFGAPAHLPTGSWSWSCLWRSLCLCHVVPVPFIAITLALLLNLFLPFVPKAVILGWVFFFPTFVVYPKVFLQTTCHLNTNTFDCCNPQVFLCKQ